MKHHLVDKDGSGTSMSTVAEHTFEEQQFLMKRSVFCVMPGGGYRWATFPVTAVLLGCLPVIVSEQRLLLPFEEGLNWDSFAIHWPVSRLSELRTHLTELSAAEVAARQVAMLEVWQYFSYDTNADGKAVDMIISLLARRKPGYAMKRGIWSLNQPNRRPRTTAIRPPVIGSGTNTTEATQTVPPKSTRLRRRWEAARSSAK
mmetsp:Transcript_25043/g.62937  ORF Transcript_25043/g.62937 Transcript_25043/m.62937 type:complete len:202 (-) Transcript_25043:168-773(-)